MQQYNTALAKGPARKIFAPMFRARWQNMQNIVSDYVYIDKIPAAYKTYYIAYIQQWLQWARGFVPQLHQKDFFSTGVGYSICEILTKMCMAGGYRIKAADKNTQTVLEKWCPDELEATFNEMFFEANAGGNCLIVLTPNRGHLYPSIIPINRATFQVGRTGRVSSARILNRFVAGENAYYTEEIRAERDGKAFWRVRISCAAPVLSPSWGERWERDVPLAIEEQWKYCYGDIKPNKWYVMPKRMRGIGVYNVKNKARASAFSDVPGYSDSTLHTCLDILYSIDYNYTQGQVDQYMGKTRCLVPKQMNSRTIQGQVGTLTEGKSFKEAVSQIEYTPLEEEFYTQIGDNTVDGKPIQPVFIQPDLRAEAHRFIRDADLELLAGKIGISASTLAAHLAGSGTKTDDQINAEGSLDEKTVGNKRKLANRAINAMLADVAYYYGCDDDVTIQWGAATSNSARDIDELQRDYQQGTLTLREYLTKRWSEKSEAEIEKLAREIEAEQDQKRKNEMSFDFPEEGALTDE